MIVDDKLGQTATIVFEGMSRNAPVAPDEVQLHAARRSGRHRNTGKMISRAGAALDSASGGLCDWMILIAVVLGSLMPNDELHAWCRISTTSLTHSRRISCMTFWFAGSLRSAPLRLARGRRCARFGVADRRCCSA